MDRLQAAIQRGESVLSEKQALAKELKLKRTDAASEIVAQLARVKDYIISRGFHVYQQYSYVAVSNGCSYFSLSADEDGTFCGVPLTRYNYRYDTAEALVEVFLEKWASGELQFLPLESPLGRSYELQF